MPNEEVELSARGVVLIVGRESDFPEYKKSRRIRILEIPRSKSFPGIPKDVEVALCTRFISHTHYDGLRRRCSVEGVHLIPDLLGTRQVRNYIQKLGVLEETPKQQRGQGDMILREVTHLNFTQPSVSSEGGRSSSLAKPADKDAPNESTQSVPPRTKGGVLKEFVRLHGNPNCPVVAQEAKRLLEITKKEGIATTFHSLEQAVRNYLKKKSVKESSSVVSEPSKRDESAQKSDESIDALQKFVDHISETGTVAELAMVAVLEIKEENLRLKKQLQEFCEENKRLREMEVRLAKLKEVLG